MVRITVGAIAVTERKVGRIPSWCHHQIGGFRKIRGWNGREGIGGEMGGGRGDVERQGTVGVAWAPPGEASLGLWSRGSPQTC